MDLLLMLKTASRIGQKFTCKILGTEALLLVTSHSAEGVEAACLGLGARICQQHTVQVPIFKYCRT